MSYLLYRLIIGLLMPFVASRSLYLQCFKKTIRRSIDNAQPIFELFYVTPYQCIDQCIITTSNSAPIARICEVFVYDNVQRACRLYDHDGNQVPAIIHPSEQHDYYRRTIKASSKLCAGPVLHSHMGSPPQLAQSPFNPNLYTLRMTSSGQLPWRSNLQASQPSAATATAAAEPEQNQMREANSNASKENGAEQSHQDFLAKTADSSTIQEDIPQVHTEHHHTTVVVGDHRQSEWNQWSECQFRSAGQMVRVRSRQCAEQWMDCTDGTLQIQQCFV